MESALYANPASGVEDKIKQYNEVLHDLLNKYAPEKSKSMTVRDNRPWMNERILNAKRRRKLEKRWRKTKLTVHRERGICARKGQC